MGKESVCQCRRHKRPEFDPWVVKIPWRRECLSAPIFLPGESHGQRSLEGYSPWGRKESDITEWLHFHFHTNSEKAMASHSSTLAWKIPWTEEPGGLQSMGSLRVRHDWATSLSLFTFMHWRRKWQPTPMFLPGESQGWGSLVGCCLWGRTESEHCQPEQLSYLNTTIQRCPSDFSSIF